jgi:hypothetical protein
VPRDLQAPVADLAQRQRQDGCVDGVAYPGVADRTRTEVDRLRQVFAKDPEPASYATMNLLVVLAAEFAPSEAREPVPAGIPVTFPVHPDGPLVSLAAHDGSAIATWQLQGADLEEVDNLYHEWLTEPLVGGWEVVASDGRRTQHPDEATTGRAPSDHRLRHHPGRFTSRPPSRAASSRSPSSSPSGSERP